MKGLFGVQSIAIMVVFLLFFGGAAFDLVTTGGRCAIAVSDPNSEYACDDLGKTILLTVVNPDLNVYKGTQGVVMLENLDNDTLTEIGILKEPQRNSFLQQIILGLVGTVILFLFLTWFFIKATPSSMIHIDSKGMAVLVALLILGILMVLAYQYSDNTPEHGYLAIFGDLTPFRGFRLFLLHWDVVMITVDSTSILPGTLTTGDLGFNGSDVT